MSKESFQPLAVKPIEDNILLFKVRCLLDLQLKTIAAFLKPAMIDLPQGTIIDIGAGESPWKSWLPEFCTYRGLDIRHSTEFAMSQRGDAITLYDGGVMPFDSNSFNGALCVEVLEHAEDPDLLLSEIFRIMKPGAVLLLTVPWSARRHHIPHDYHRFTKERLSIMFTHHGFTDVVILERGNDYCVIASKIIIAVLRNILCLNFYNFLYRIPILMILAPMAITLLIIAHVSLWFNHAENTDPLGYACKLVKP
jgi:SAM-dependent methyltransferase